MFLTNKQKNYPYYHKPSKVYSEKETIKNKLQPQRRAYNIKVLEGGYINTPPLKAVMRLFKWFSKTHALTEEQLTLRLNLFPDFVLTSKPKEMRMGKGKGAPNSKVAIIRKGAIFLSLNCERDFYYLGWQLVKKMSQKIPLKHKIVLIDW